MNSQRLQQGKDEFGEHDSPEKKASPVNVKNSPDIGKRIIDDHLYNNNTNPTFNHGLNEFEHHVPSNYLDPNWDPSLLIDPSNEMQHLYNIDTGIPHTDPAGPNSIDNVSSNHNNNLNDHSRTHSHSHSHSASASGAKSIMQSIQFQNNIHSEPPIALKGSKIDSNHQGDHNFNIVPNTSAQPQPSNEPEKPSDIPMNNIHPFPPKASKQRRPCDHCRRRKTKCVIIPNTNNCIQCEAKSLTCTYTSQAIKRKNTETDLDMASKRKPPGDNESNSLEAYDHSLHQDDTIVPPNVAIRDVAPVQDYSSISNSLLKKTLSLQFPRSSFYVGPTSYLYDINLLNVILDSQNQTNNFEPKSGNNSSGKIEQVNLNESISLRKVGEKVQFVLKDDQSPHSYQSMSNDVDTIEKFIAPHGQILIDLYFRIIHPSYPILHKKVFLEKYSRTHREFSAPLLAAVYVLAIQWWDYDPQLKRFPKPNVDTILKIGLNNYLLEILKRPKLSAVQAGLLLLQCKTVIQTNVNRTPATEKSKQAFAAGTTPGISKQFVGDSDYSDWVLCSQVVSLAEELGLGLNCNNWKLPKWERGLRKRLAWAVYIEDKWLALKNSRPSHIHDSNWVVQPLVEEDFPEKHGDGDLKEGSSDIDNGKKIFRNFIDLSMILSDIIDQFYSMKAMQEITDVQQVLKLAKPLQLRLRNWYHSLPVELQMSSVQPRKLCSNGYLQLAYFSTELSLHRKISSVIYQQTLAGNPPPPELVSVCRSAAKTRLLGSIEYVRDLKPEHIHSFWHSSAASNYTLIGTFAAILFISAPAKEEADFYRDQIFNYRWILKMSSKGFDQVAEALAQLDLVLGHIPGLLNGNSELPMVPTVPTVDYQQKDGHSRSNSSVNKPAQNQSFYGRPKNFNPPTNNGTNSTGASESSAYNSPQNFNNPQSSPQNQPLPQTISRGGQFVVNSPQSSQGLSPKEIIKQQRSVRGELGFRDVKKSPKSLSNMPILSAEQSTDNDE